MLRTSDAQNGSHRVTSMLAAIIAVPLLACCLFACSGQPKLDYIEGDAVYTSTQALDSAKGTDVSAFESLPVTEAAVLRARLLGPLRSRGDTATDFVDLYTRLFRGQSRAVPVRVETAIVDGAESWVIVEVWGQPGGMLEHTRLWLIDRRSGDVISSTSFR